MINYTEMVSAVVLTATPTSCYTAPVSTMAAVHACTAVNPTGAAVTVNIYRVTAGAAMATPCRIASRTIPAGQTLSLIDAINHKLAPGSQLFADGAGCGLNVSGVEYLPSN